MSENQKKVWITGASSGIGKATAEKFAQEGWRVAVSARRKELLDDMAKNDNIFSYPLDVVDEENCSNTFQKIISDFTEINLCIFCSGTYDPKKEKEIDLKQSKFVMDVNYFGVLNCVKAVENILKIKEKGIFQ